eukprot:TRINITY_DN1170_c0_g1_i18.p2 TRINITY_DN1170_c0_g1~~TRINITY_DN1170_c0_g1_i18.p2  ORF type:complete len:271 (+),score=55.34 TRINITY_DN1170_c0_g1_i18:319-1131(+)
MIQPQQPIIQPPSLNTSAQPLNNQNVNMNKLSGFQKLSMIQNIYVKQKIESSVCCVAAENTYYVYKANDKGQKKGDKIFKCVEKSNCISRCCMNGDSRPLDIIVTHEAEGFDTNEDEEFLKLSREFKCTCLCMQRPTLKVTYTENKEEKELGSIRSPWTACDYILEVLDKHENVKYVITASCCQLGFHCKLPFESCQNIRFEIKDPKGEKNLSFLHKKSAGCMAAAKSDEDNFHLEFPEDCTPQDRALLMAAVLFLDFRFFEENRQAKNE